MKTKIKSFLYGGLIFILPVCVHAQPGRAHKPLEVINTFSGKVIEWTYNDDFLYDGFHLQTDGEIYVVKFPPHLAKSLRECGNMVTVKGTLKYSPEGVQEICMLSVEGNSLVVNDIPQAPPVPPIASVENFTDGQGKVTRLQLNRKGDISGYILDNRIALRIPPHISEQLAGLERGVTLEYKGVKHPRKEGEVSNGDYTVVRCQTLTVAGTQYLIK